MGSDWKDDLRNFFHEFSIVEASKKETLEDFDQFCEFVVEPAFEALGEELKEYGISSRFRRIKGERAAFMVRFSNTRIDQFQYIISLPKNSLELRLKLKTRGRKDKKSGMKEKEQKFMDHVPPKEILKLKKEEIIQDVIQSYRDFILEALTSPE
ncbi:MAG: hypothetical protein ACE5LV_09400 [Candidatus Aminicenantales bacterium]